MALVGEALYLIFVPDSRWYEARLSRLARWIVQADGVGQRFALSLPGRMVDADGGPAHREACLEALAL